MKKCLPLLFLAFLFGCGSHTPQDNSSTITSMQIIDRNGFAETFSNKDRIQTYKDVDFLSSQPYQKILRVYGRNTLGQSTSKMTSYHDNGQLWQYLEVVDGRAHGLYREWFANGQLKIESNLIEGLADLHDLAQKSWVFDGLSRVWNDQGTLVAEIHYDKGVLHTPSLYYHANGSLQKTLPFNAGHLEGDLLIFDPQGCLIEQIPYVQGQKQGKACAYWTLEQPLYVEEYSRDVLQNAFYCDPTGKVVARIEEGKGQQAVFKDDYLYSLIEYQNGAPEGLVTLFREDGTIHMTYMIKDGQKHGEEWEYYPYKINEKPQAKLCVHWHEDKLQGVVKTWFAHGVMESQREIIGDKKQGLSFAWYKNGDLMLMEEYQNDNLLKGAYFKKADKAPVSKIEEGKGIATLYTSDGLFMKKVSYEKGRPKIDDEF